MLAAVVARRVRRGGCARRRGSPARRRRRGRRGRACRARAGRVSGAPLSLRRPIIVLLVVERGRGPRPRSACGCAARRGTCRRASTPAAPPRRPRRAAPSPAGSSTFEVVRAVLEAHQVARRSAAVLVVATCGRSRAGVQRSDGRAASEAQQVADGVERDLRVVGARLHAEVAVAAGRVELVAGSGPSGASAAGRRRAQAEAVAPVALEQRRARGRSSPSAATARRPTASPVSAGGSARLAGDACRPAGRRSSAAPRSSTRAAGRAAAPRRRRRRRRRRTPAGPARAWRCRPGAGRRRGRSRPGRRAPARRRRPSRPRSPPSRPRRGRARRRRWRASAAGDAVAAEAAAAGRPPSSVPAGACPRPSTAARRAPSICCGERAPVLRGQLGVVGEAQRRVALVAVQAPLHLGEPGRRCRRSASLASPRSTSAGSQRLERRSAPVEVALEVRQVGVRVAVLLAGDLAVRRPRRAARPRRWRSARPGGRGRRSCRRAP